MSTYVWFAGALNCQLVDLSLPSSLFNHFFLWNWPWILLTFIQTGQSDRQPITDESKTQGISKRQQDQHSRHIKKGGKGKTVKGVKNIIFWPVILRSLKDMLMKLCFFSRLCHFQYFSSQCESAFYGICYIYLDENSIQHVFWLLFYAPFHGYKHMFEAATMILGSVTLPFFFLWHFTWHISLYVSNRSSQNCKEGKGRIAQTHCQLEFNKNLNYEWEWV